MYMTYKTQLSNTIIIMCIFFRGGTIVTVMGENLDSVFQPQLITTISTVGDNHTQTNTTV